MLDFLDVLFLDFVTVLRNRHAAAVVETFEMGTGHRRHHFGDFAVGFFLRLGNGIGQTQGDLPDVDDLAFAHAARGRFARADDAQQSVAARLGNDRRNLGGSDFQTDMEIRSRHGRDQGFLAAFSTVSASGASPTKMTGVLRSGMRLAVAMRREV